MTNISIGNKEVIHFIGIGGIGMSGLAQIMKIMGFKVQGSDLNKNKKLDTNFLGIPKEPYGFSNEKKGRFGPPKFKEVSFKLNKSSIFKISIE